MDQAAPLAADDAERPVGSLAKEQARIQQLMPGWDVWYVLIHQPHGVRWCGRPAGHPVAAAEGGTGDELIGNARAWAESQEAGK